MKEILLSGWEALVAYFTLPRVISLTIAFFLSGAIATFMSQGAVVKHFGPDAPKTLSYLVASVSGAILAVCSCSVLPMFASIRKKGAGIGPAITFLFSGPAINILAITMTFSMIGVAIGLVRVIGAIVLSLIIGVIISLLYRKSETVEANAAMFVSDAISPRKTWQNLLFFATLIAILVLGVKNPLPTGILTIVLGVQLIMYFQKSELWTWVKETAKLAKKIIPLFIIGIFLAGIITYLIPPATMVRLVGANTIWANLLGSGFGALMYFATLTEVPIVTSFLSLGMGMGPATALLLAGPTLSLPNMIVIAKVLGIKKGFTYFGLVILLSGAIGFMAGLWIY